MSVRTYGEDAFTNLAHEWPEDQVTGRLFASYAWLAAFRQRLEGSHRWYMTSDDHGSVGLMATILTEDIPSEAKNPRRLMTEICPSLRSDRRIAELAEALDRRHPPPPDRWFPALVAIYPGFECFPVRRGQVSVGLLGELVDGILADAERAGCRTVSFLFVPDDEFASVLCQRGLTACYTATSSTLTLPGSDYADYLGSLDRKRRADARKQDSALAVAGVTVSEGPLMSDLLDELTELRLDDRRKHGRRLDGRGEREVLATFLNRFPDRTRVTVARREGEALAFGLMLAAESGVEHAWTQGVRLTAGNSLALYLSCVYYVPIRCAYDRGVTSINYGYGTARVKRLRGCQEEEMHSWFLARDPRTADHVRALADTALRVERTA